MKSPPEKEMPPAGAPVAQGTDTHRTEVSLPEDDDARHRAKRIATCVAELARRGAQCHQVGSGRFMVLAGGLTRHFSDLDALAQFVRRLIGGRS